MNQFRQQQPEQPEQAAQIFQAERQPEELEPQIRLRPPQFRVPSDEPLATAVYNPAEEQKYSIEQEFVQLDDGVPQNLLLVHKKQSISSSVSNNSLAQNVQSAIFLRKSSQMSGRAVDEQQALAMMNEMSVVHVESQRSSAVIERIEK